MQTLDWLESAAQNTSEARYLMSDLDRDPRNTDMQAVFDDVHELNITQLLEVEVPWVIFFVFRH